MKGKITALILILGTMYSCASRHTMMQGTVAMKIDNSSGIACMEANQMKVGNTLYLYNNDCSGKEASPREGKGISCKLVKVGQVEVTRLVNDHYSEFKTLTNTSFSEGSVIKDK